MADLDPLDPTLPEPPDHESSQLFLLEQAAPAWGPGWPNCQAGRQVRVTSGGVSVNCRAEIAPLVAYALRETRNVGYVLKQEQTGAYVCRPIGGTSIPSNHSWGLAVDLNWNENPFTTNPNAPRTITPAVVAVWKSVGFAWGGDWSGKKDFMHMEFNGSPDAAARRVAALGTRFIEGIDVSHYQGLFDWQAAADVGIKFAWFKVSGSGTDPLFTDPHGSRNRAETRRVGLHAGPYHFFLGSHGVSGAEQARHFRRCAGPSAPGDLRAALDLEDPPSGSITLTRDDCRSLVQETAHLFGHLPAIYLGESMFTRFPWLEEELQGCPLWIPNWSRPPSRPCAVHQWTNARPIPGRSPVDGNRAVDLADVLIGPEEEDPLSEASDRIERGIAALDARLRRIEDRGLRQIAAPNGDVYLYNGLTRMWVVDEPWRLALAAYLSFTGPPDPWTHEGIDLIPLVGPAPPHGTRGT